MFKTCDKKKQHLISFGRWFENEFILFHCLWMFPLTNHIVVIKSTMGMFFLVLWKFLKKKKASELLQNFQDYIIRKTTKDDRAKCGKIPGVVSAYISYLTCIPIPLHIHLIRLFEGTAIAFIFWNARDNKLFSGKNRLFFEAIGGKNLK